MSYLKLCQLLCQGNPDEHGIPQTIYYLEDCDGNVLVNNPTFPITLECEVIDWVSQDEFNKRGQAISFNSVNVTLNNAPVGSSIRQAVFDDLVATYPALVI